MKWLLASKVRNETTRSYGKRLINFYDSLKLWLDHKSSDIWWNVISGWSVRVFLEELAFESESWVKQIALPSEKGHHPMCWGSKQYNNSSKMKRHWLFSLRNCWARVLICPQHSWFSNVWTQTRVSIISFLPCRPSDYILGFPALPVCRLQVLWLSVFTWANTLS